MNMGIDTEALQAVANTYKKISAEVHQLKNDVTETNQVLTEEDWTGDDAREFALQYKELEQIVDRTLEKLESVGPLVLNLALDMENQVESNSSFIKGGF